MPDEAYAMLPQDWAAFCKAAGLPAFRAKQILQGLYRDRIADWAALTTLPPALRERLAAEMPLRQPREVTRTPAGGDGVVKYLLEMADGERV